MYGSQDNRAPLGQKNLSSTTLGMFGIQIKQSYCSVSETPPNTTFAGCDSTDDGEAEGVVDDSNDLVEDPRGHVDHPLAQTNYPTTPETDEMMSQVDKTRPKTQRHDGRQRASSRQAHRAARPA